MRYSDKVKEANPIAYTIINNAIKNNKVPHAYLFSAQAGQDIVDEYMFVIQELISKDELRDPKIYPDLTFLDGSQGLIKKDAVTEAIGKLQETALDSAGIKFLVIRNVEHSNKQSLNSLLKFIEEPTKDTYILMTTNNVQSVLPTIRSRSQVVSIKPLNITSFANDLIEEGIPLKDSRLVATMFNSKENALSGYNENFLSYKESVINAMNSALEHPSSLISNFSKVIIKSNYQITLTMLREFINDIWRSEQLLPLSFPEEKEITNKYALSSFDFSKALSAINDFIVQRNYYLNFDLQKNKLLILLGECYA